MMALMGLKMLADTIPVALEVNGLDIVKSHGWHILRRDFYFWFYPKLKTKKQSCFKHTERFWPSPHIIFPLIYLLTFNYRTHSELDIKKVNYDLLA